MPYPLSYRLAVHDRHASRQALVEADKKLVALMKAKRDIEEQIMEASIKQRVADKLFTEIERQLDTLVCNRAPTEKAAMHNVLQRLWRAQENLHSSRDTADTVHMRFELAEARHEFLLLQREMAAIGDVVFTGYDEDNHPTFGILEVEN